MISDVEKFLNAVSEGDNFFSSGGTTGSLKEAKSTEDLVKMLVRTSDREWQVAFTKKSFTLSQLKTSSLTLFIFTEDEGDNIFIITNRRS